jgi:nitroreductase
VPWCERCSRFLNPNTVTTDGSCPTCGRAVEATERPGIFRDVERSTDLQDRTTAPDSNDDEGVTAPWHFWLMVAGVGLYLGWRLIQGVFWAAHNWF